MPHISWQMVAVIGAFLAAIATGAVQLGSVQTHVVINTGRVSVLESDYHALVQRLTRVEAHQELNEKRIEHLGSMGK